MSEPDEILTAKEVGKLLKLHRTTIYQLAGGGFLPGVQIGRAWRFKKSEIFKLLENGHQKTVDEVTAGNFEK